MVFIIILKITYHCKYIVYVLVFFKTDICLRFTSISMAMSTILVHICTLNVKIETAIKLHQYGSYLLLADNLGNMQNYKMKNVIYIMSKK